MDKERIAHDLALVAAKAITEDVGDNQMKYGYGDYISQLLHNYTRAKEQILDEFED